MCDKINCLRSYFNNFSALLQDLLQKAGTLKISCRMQAHSRTPAECRYTQDLLLNASTLKISCRMQAHSRTPAE
jgi:hypothetical protein